MEICYNIKLKTALACLLLLSGALLFAQTETEGIEGVHTEKNAVMDDSTHGHITLNTYVEGEVKVKTQSVPCDIVMVLDFSAAMGTPENVEKLQISCLNFLGKIRENNENHRVAIVSYNKYSTRAAGSGAIYDYDGAVVWPQIFDNRTTLEDYNTFGARPGGDFDNSITLPKNQNQELSDYVRGSGEGQLHSFFIPVGAKLHDGDKDCVLDKIVNSFATSDFGNDGNSFRGLQVAKELLWGIDASDPKSRDGDWYENNKANWGWVCRGDDKYVDNDPSSGQLKPTFVILFTTGVPGLPPNTKLSFEDDNFSVQYALNAIGESNQLKTNGTVVFTVGINQSCYPDLSSSIYNNKIDWSTYMTGRHYLTPADLAFNVYLHLVSNNFKGDAYHIASNITRGDQVTMPDGKKMDYRDVIDARITKLWNNRNGTSSSSFDFKISHYLGANQSSGMDDAFIAISEEIIEELPAMPLSSETVLKDYIDGRFFSLPEGATPATIQVYTHNCIGGTKVGDTYTKFEFDKIDAPVDRVVVKVETDTERYNNLISVKGFDYAANWVGQDTQGNWRGKELVVVIPFVIKEGVVVSGTLQTNTGDSGIYLPDSDEPLKPYPIPEIVYWNLNIKRTFLEKGESAVYSVYIRKEGESTWPANPNYIINLTAGATGPVERTIVDAPVIQSGVYNEFKVVETGWSWAYESTNTDSEHALVKKYDPDKKELNFEFTGGHKDITNTDKAYYKLNHNESITTSTFKINNK